MKHVAPPTAVNLLDQAIVHASTYLDASLPITERARTFWAAVIAGRCLGADDVVADEFTELARQAGLKRELGADSVAHIIRCAFLDWNPFC